MLGEIETDFRELLRKASLQSLVLAIIRHRLAPICNANNLKYERGNST